MATIKVVKKRDQAAHFGLYRTSAGGDQEIFIRRKVADPTDYMHTNSRKVQRQRTNLALASQHYAQLTPSQKAITRHQIEDVEFIKSHGKSDTKLLMGRQLFISKEMHSLETQGKRLYLPHELCIMLVDENLSPIIGELTLKYLDLGEWWNIHGEEIGTGNWLFSLVPASMEAYRPHGEAEGYFDPELPEHQNMTEDEILPYHYHKLVLFVESEILEPIGDSYLKELASTDFWHYAMLQVEDTTWIPPNGGGAFGYWTGSFVSCPWWPWKEKADLYEFANPLYAPKLVKKLIFHCLIGRNQYPYGRVRLIFSTHGQKYYSDYVYPNQPFQWFEPELTKNPYTNELWTREEVQSLLAGLSMDTLTMYSRLMCDRMFIELRYL